MSTRQKFLTFLFFSAIFLSLPKYTLAAFSIKEVSSSVINSSDDAIIVTATVSGLQNNPQYLQIGFTLFGATTKLFGITKNNGDEWYFYKSSPIVSDLTSTFYNFTHNNGSWSGQIYGKVDINSDGYYGPGEYKLRLYKYTISTSQNVSSSFVEWEPVIKIDIPPPPTPVPTITPEPTATTVPEPTNTPALTPTPKPPTSPPTPRPTLKPTATATVSGEILGSEESTTAALPAGRQGFYPWEASGEAEPVLGEKSSSPNRLPPAILLGAGFILLFSAAFWLWYTQLRK